MARPIDNAGLAQYQFNDKTDFDIDVAPGNIYDFIQDYIKTEMKENPFKFEVNNEK